MPNQIQISNASGKNRNDIISLLRKENLPTEDLPLALDHFIIATDINKQLIGAIGLETYSKYGLLRSMVVNSSYRKLGIASALVNKLETQASQMGFHFIYLLTETAGEYFKRKGYTAINRNEVPVEIKGSTEFSNVCPVSAEVMVKQIYF